MKKLIKLVCVLIVFALIFPYASRVIVYADDSPIYISEVKIANATDVTPQAEATAKESLTNAGYIVLDNNLNAGTGRAASYIGYKTTKDEKEAITDLAAMDMDGGYELNNLSATLSYYKGSIKEKSDGMMVAARELKVNFDKGSPAAKLAMQTLNYIVVKKNNNQPLGDYLTDEKRVYEDFYDIVLKCDPNILIFIISQFSLGVADYQTETWIERYSNMNPSGNYPADTYHEKAMTLYPQVQAFAKRYKEAVAATEKFGEIDFDDISIIGQENVASSEATSTKDIPPDETDSSQNTVVSETQSSEATSSEASSTQTESSEATSSESTSSEATSTQTESSESTSSEATSTQTESSETTSSESTSSETKSSATSSEVASSEAISSESKPDKDVAMENGLEKALNTDVSEEKKTVSPQMMRTLTAYEMLNEYTYNGDGIGDILTDLQFAAELYPLVAAFEKNEGQLAMMVNSDIETFVMNLTNNTETATDVYKKLSIQIEQESMHLKGVDLWENTVESVFEDREVGLTNKAVRESTAQNNMDALARVDTTKQELSVALKIVGGIVTIGFTAAQTAWIVMSAAFGAKFAFTTLLSTIGTTYAASVGGAFAASIFSGGMIVLALCVLALVGIAIYYIVDAIKKQIEYNNPTFKDIPESMFDFFEDATDPENTEELISRYVEYKAVTDMSGKLGDLNAWNGLKWNALYYTKDPIAGSPIKADFIVKYGDGTVPLDYSPLHKFGEVTAFDTNTNMRKDDLRGCFIFFQRKDGNKEKVEGEFLYEIVVKEGANQTEVMSYFATKGYTPLKTDLLAQGGANKNSKVAYLGYKTTRDETIAVRDIRVAANCGVGQLNLGEATYANGGTYGNITLYYSKKDVAGDPVLADFFTANKISQTPPTADFVPISLISGGPAANLTMSIAPSMDVEDKVQYDPTVLPQTYIYYRSSVSYDSGPDYISGFAFFDYKGKKTEDVAMNTMTANGYNYIGQDITNGSGNVFYYVNKMGYSTTKNPKRALRKVYTYHANKSSITMPLSTMRDGIGYVASPRFSISEYMISYDEGKTRVWNYNTRINPSNTLVQYDASTAMYATYATSQGERFTKEDIMFEGVMTQYTTSSPSGYYSVADWYDPNYWAANIKQGCWQKDIIHMYIKGAKQTPGAYVSKLIVGASEQDGEYAKIDLFNQGATQNSYVTSNATGTASNESEHSGAYLDTSNREGGAKLIHQTLGLSRTTDFNYAITDIKMVPYTEDAKTKPETPESITIKGMKYQLASKKPFTILPSGSHNKPGVGVYAYYTTNPNGGDPIIDVKWNVRTTRLSGYENASYMIDKAIAPGCEDLTRFIAQQTKIATIFMKREKTANNVYLKSIDAATTSEVYYANDAKAVTKLNLMGNSFIVKDSSGTDFSMNSTNDGDYVFIGYNKTHNKDDSITGLVTKVVPKGTPREETISFRGVNYAAHSSLIDFNSNCTSNSYTVYLYYTKDPSAGRPITDVMASYNSSESGWDYVPNTTGYIGNFNDGDYNCDPSPTYLHIKRADGVVSERPSWNFASVFTGLNSISTITIFIVMIALGTTLIIYQKRRTRKIKTK